VYYFTLSRCQSVKLFFQFNFSHLFSFGFCKTESRISVSGSVVQTSLLIKCIFVQLWKSCHRRYARRQSPNYWADQLAKLRGSWRTPTLHSDVCRLDRLSRASFAFPCTATKQCPNVLPAYTTEAPVHFDGGCNASLTGVFSTTTSRVRVAQNNSKSTRYSAFPPTAAELS